MTQPPASSYVEIRDGGYYVANTRIGLDTILHEFQAGRSPESILQSYPSIGSLAKVYGVITFILEHPAAVENYLQDQNRLWEELQQEHPISEEMLQKFYRARELARKSA